MKKTNLKSDENILLDTLDRLAVLIDRDGKIIMLNKIAADFTGQTKEFLIGKSLFDFIPKEFPKSRRKKIISVIEKGEKYTFEEELNNEMFFVTIMPVFSDDVVKYIAIYSTNITKQVIAEKQLTEKERKYHSIFESAGDAIFLMKGEIFIDCNKKTLEMFNCTREQIIGNPPYTFSPPIQPDGRESQEKALEKINASLSGENKPFYWKHKKYNGTLFDASVTLNKVELETNDYILAIVRDISEEKKANEEIRHLSQFQKSIIENANVWLNVLDINGNTIIWNKAAEKISGYSKEEVIGHQKIWEWLYPDLEYRQKIFKKASEIIHNNQTVENFETTITVKSGESKIINWFSRNLTDKEGKITGSVALGIDITDKKITRENLRKSEHRYRLLAENITDIIWILNMNLKFTFISPSVYRFRGYTVEEALKQPLNEVFTPASFKKVKEIFNKEISKINKEPDYSTRRITIELEQYCKNGKIIWTEVIASFIYDESGEPIGIIGATKNIDKRKRAQKAKAEIEEHLRQSQKLEAVGRLAGGIAHDFNNMLTAIIVNADILLLSGETDKKTTEGLNEIKKSSQRASALTRQLLAFSKKQLLKPQILSINDLINRLEKMLVRIIDPNIQFISTQEANLKPVKADPGQIEQIIMNLVINASDSIKEQGKISISAKNVNIDKKYCNNNSEAYPSEFISIKIIDNGKGMNKEVINHIFEPFFTTKDKGTGLGLAVAHGLIKQHNGWITVKSKPDEGSELEFFIPVHNEPQEKTSKKPDDAEIILNGSNETILYIEDEISIRKIVGSALNKHNYNVISASNYEEAKNLFYKNKEKIDLIFSDIFLFESSALDLLDELTIPENIKVILTSGYTGNEEIWDKIVKKNIPFIQKPFPVNSLLKLIQETLHN